MDQAIKSKGSKKHSFSRRYLTEFSYQKDLKPLLVLSALPSFMFFAVYHFLNGHLFPATLFTLLIFNAVVTLAWATQIKDIQKLARLNLVGISIAFVLLGLVLVSELSSGHIYIALPWVFIYPAVILLMMGERIGLFGAAGFVSAVIITLVVTDLPPWSAANILTFKLNIAFALVAILLYTLLAERLRVKMRNKLLEARNKFKASEMRQRLGNEVLKNEIEMRAQSEKALSQSELRYRALFEESAVALWEEDQSEIKEYLDNLPQEAVENLENYLNQRRDEVKKFINATRITAVNRATLKLYEASSRKELLENIRNVLPPDIVGWTIRRISALYRHGHFQSPLEPKTIHGRKLNTLVSSAVPAGYESSWAKVYTSNYDITDRTAMEEEKKRVEQQLQHTRQIQAIASLAGGIAHQFNNALAAISGSVELLELQTPVTPDTEPLFRTLRGSSERVRHLTEQLLAYAQGGKYQPADFAVEALVLNLLKCSKGLAPSLVHLKTHFKDNVILSQCDITQIQMVLQAALTNAMEAMPNGGEIVISSDKVCFTEGQTPVLPDLAPGHYARITIEDHGPGMEEEIRRRIFEPFFSTKFVGRGLGMAAAFGIVRNHDGLIEVASEPGVGTRVMIYLPCRPF